MASFEIKRRNGDVHIVLVDDGDLERVLAAGPWRIVAGGYAGRHAGPGEHAYLHRLVMDAPPGTNVDHVDSNGLDNRRDNLRLCDQSRNNCNSRRRVDNTSGEKGLSFDGSRKRWKAAVQIEGRAVQRRFLSRREAEAWLQSVRPAMHGEFARFK